MSALLVSLPWAAIVGALLFAASRERTANAEERATLLQRIQAPTVAVAQHVATTAPEPVEEDELEDPAFTNIP
jgi:hypothetical protein